jgi:DNA polymerase
MKDYYESGRLAAHWVRDFCFGDFDGCSRYQLEESGKWHPDWMLPDGSLDERLRDASGGRR